MTRATILLWDIDGTLVDGDGAGRRAMEAGFRDVVGDASPLAAFSFAGMTDPAIVRAGLRVAGVAESQHPTAIERVLASYVEHLPVAIAATPKFRLHRGVLALFDRMRELVGPLAVGLGTGNVVRGAEHKLAPLGIWDRFAFGGFGSDNEDRAELLAIGAERGAARLGRARADCRVVVIGDTPLDVAAALAIGAECLAVATSVHDTDALARAGAHVVVEHLEDPAAFAALR